MPKGKKPMREKTLQERCPSLLELIDEEIDEAYQLAVVDPNIEEEADEADVFDPTEYNWMIYLPERVAEALGEELFARVPEELEKVDTFEEIYDAEGDLLALRSDLSEEEILQIVLEKLEALARRKIEEGEDG